MNKQGNRRTTKEGSSDLKFQNFSLQKNRSWPHISSPAGQYQAIKEPLLDCERNFAAAPDGAKSYSDDDYEDPKLLRAERWRAVRLFPARPAKEPEYADTRCFRGVTDRSLPRDGTTSIPMERQAWISQMRLEDVDKPNSQDLRSHHVKGDAPTKGSKTPLPPPRPPVTLPKKYQPLPPEPESCRPSCPLRHTFPEAQGRARQINLKNLSEVLGAEKVPPRQGKPESSCLSQNQNTQAVPVAITSSSFLTSNDSAQKWGKRTLGEHHNDTDHQETMRFHSPQRCPSPASHDYHNNLLCYKNTSWRRPSPARSEDKPGQWDVPHNEWYIGEYSRQAVEEALMKENKDGTFLVRDCSTKSRAEPYVLVVFYGNKVYNVKIRFLEKNQQFALGTGLRGDEKFNSVEDIIEHYKYFPIILIDGKDKSGVRRQQCYLARPLPLSRLRPAW